MGVIMNTIHNNDELKALRATLKQKLADDGKNKVIIRVAMATCSIASGASPVMAAFAEQLPRHPVQFVLKSTGCTGLCHAEPTVEITKPGAEPVMFGKVQAKQVADIIDKFIMKDEPVEGIVR